MMSAISGQSGDLRPTGLTSPVITTWLAASLSVACLQALLNTWLINPDPFIYGQAAKLWIQGERLYAGAWQDRPPVAMMFYAVSQWLWPGSYLAMTLWLALWLAGQCLLLAWWCRDQPRGSMVGIVLLAVLPFAFWDLWWPSTEHVANLFTLAMLLTAWRIEQTRQCRPGWAILVGAAAVLALHSRQTAAIFALAPLLTWLRNRPRAGETGRLIGYGLLGATVTWGALLAFLSVTADLRGYADVTLVYPFRFLAQNLGQSRWELIAAISHTPLLAITAMLMLAAHAARRRFFAWTILTLGLIACFASSRSHTHYWVQLFPVLAVLGVVACDDAGPSGVLPRRLILAAALLTGLGGPLAFVQSAKVSPTGQWLREVADAVNELSQPGDTLYVSGPMPADKIAFASSVPPAHRFYCAWQIERPRGDLLPQPPEAIIEDYVRTPPTLLALHDAHADQVRRAIQLPDQPPLPEGLVLVRRLVTTYRYDPVAQVNGYTLFRRVMMDASGP